MKRFIRYLYEYEQGKRLRNVGFVKVEQQDKDCTLNIHGKGLHMKGEQKLDLYLFFEDGGDCIGILQGTVDNVNPAINYRLYFTEEDVIAPENFQRVNGIILESEMGRKYAAVWNDGAIDVSRMRVLRPEAVRKEEPRDENAGMREETKRQEEAGNAEEVQIGEETAAKREAVRQEMPVQGQEAAGSEGLRREEGMMEAVIPGPEDMSRETLPPGQESMSPGSGLPGRESRSPGSGLPGQENMSPGSEPPGQENMSPGSEPPGQESMSREALPPGQESMSRETSPPGQESRSPGSEPPGQGEMQQETVRPGRGARGEEVLPVQEAVPGSAGSESTMEQRPQLRPGGTAVQEERMLQNSHSMHAGVPVRREEPGRETRPGREVPLPEEGAGRKPGPATSDRNPRQSVNQQHEVFPNTDADLEMSQELTAQPVESICADAEEPEPEERFRCTKIQRNDIARLPRCEWKWANNSFLLHGYYNYHHLAIIHDGEKYRLGVPGIYHPQEAKAANSFGFSEFIPYQDMDMDLTDDEKSSQERFGYWCRPIRRMLKT